MREDIKLKKYRKICKDVNDLYCTKFINVKQSCQKIGISPSVYYKACKELGKNSVGTETNKSSKLKQRGGSKSTKKTSTSKKTITKNTNNDTSSINNELNGINLDSTDSKRHISRHLKMNT
jgi:hypothetical protein